MSIFRLNFNALTCVFALAACATDESTIAQPAASEPAASEPAASEPAASEPAAPVSDAYALVINEAVAAHYDGDTDWVELLAVGPSPVHVGDYYLVDGNPDHAPARLPDVILAPGAYLVVRATDDEYEDRVPFKLGKSDALILTLGALGPEIDRTSWVEGDAPEGLSWGRFPDGTGPFVTQIPTRGEPNQTGQADPTAPLPPFVEDQVTEVHFELPAESWQAMLDDPLAETYYEGNLRFGDLSVDQVAIRFKGNSSLNFVARSGDERFSFKVDTNRYVDGQTVYGEKKLNFNNGFNDPSLIREHLALKVLTDLGLPAPRTSFVDLYVNDRHMGLYTLVEHVDGVFVEQHFDDGDGDLYKPQRPAGNLEWMGSDLTEVEGLGIERNEDTTDHAAMLAFLETLNQRPEAAPLDEVLDIDMALRYLAGIVALGALDSYIGPGHNYYLYEVDGRFTVIPWDFNGAFGVFNCGCDRAGIIDFRIDEPTCGPMSGKPLVDRLLEDPDRKATYHQYLQMLLDGPMSEATMQARIDKAADLIRPYVEADENLFYSVDDFEQALANDLTASSSRGSSPRRDVIGLSTFVSERGESIRAQLAEQMASTADGQGACQSMQPSRGGGDRPEVGGRGRCGDGLCDGVEQENSALCPEDCQ